MLFTTKVRYVLVLSGFLVACVFLRSWSHLPSIHSYLPNQPWTEKSTTVEYTDIVAGGGSDRHPTEAASALANLWSKVHRAIEGHDPHEYLSMTWSSGWPTMPQYQMDKTFDKEEVIASSPKLSEDDLQKGLNAHASLLQAIPKWSDHSSLYSGRGYVMTSGNAFLNRVFPVGIQMLHRLGSDLPIEIWTKDQDEFEMTDVVVRQLSKDFGITISCRRFSDYVDTTQFPAGYTSNYLMKSLAILLSSFEEVILLDADNVPVLSPQPLLESRQYKETGLILWPDFWANSLSENLHTILDIPYTFLRTCESGQIVLDKRKHFESLILASYFNWYGDVYYKLITLDGMGAGDKDTFVVGAQALGRPFHFVTRPLELLRAVYLNGSQWREDTSVFNGAMGQFNPLNMSEIMFMHMHSPKLNFVHQDIGTDLVFVRSDAPDVHFSPNASYLEKLIWQSVKWVECISVLKLENDETHLCQRVEERLEIMK